MFATAFMLNMLLQYGHTIFADGTFQVTELGLVLTTIMVTINGIGFPAAWLLSNSGTAVNYEWFLTQVKAAIKTGTWTVEVAYTDFDKALRGGIKHVFPSAILLGDSFHFFYDNRKWASKNKGTEYLYFFVQ